MDTWLISKFDISRKKFLDVSQMSGIYWNRLFYTHSNHFPRILNGLEVLKVNNRSVSLVRHTQLPVIEQLNRYQNINF